MALQNTINYIEKRIAEINAKLSDIDKVYFASAEDAKNSNGFYEEGAYMGFDMGMQDYFDAIAPYTTERDIIQNILNMLKSE